MSISDNTINAQYEYRIANIVRKLLIYKAHIPKNGEDLKRWMSDNRSIVHMALLDDIQESSRSK